PGALQLYRTPHKQVLNFPTKRHWRHPSRLDDIEAGLRTFAASWANHGIASAAFPLLGCGSGGLDWETQVRPLMERWLAPLPIRCLIHVPGSDRAARRETERTRAWLRGEPVVLEYAAFRDRLIVAAERLAGWLVGETDGLAIAPTGASAESVRADDWFDMWRTLRAIGLLTGDDLPPSLAPHAGAAFDLLGAVERLLPARAISISPAMPYDARSTTELFANPVARAVRTASQLAETARRGTTAEDAEPCPANPTMPRSQLPLIA
ncbi:MAG: macro domain-containing protein, partial [Thermomicrobiales bacterium]|nr:macro domain-containing protein [Thermomicrobiales bacterium]